MYIKKCGPHFQMIFFMEYSLFILSISLNSIHVVLQKSTTWTFFKSSILMKDNARHLVTQKSFWEFHHVVNNIVVWAGPRERVESSLAQPRHSRPKPSVAAIIKYRGPILRVTWSALGSNDLSLDQSATSIQILREPVLVTWHVFIKLRLYHLPTSSYQRILWTPP